MGSKGGGVQWVYQSVFDENSCLLLMLLEMIQMKVVTEKIS